MKEVEIYTDGACSGNPGIGGWAAILCSGDKEKVISGAEQRTTNNRMELTAAIEALKALRYPCSVTLYSDSSYLIKAFTEGWIRNWKRDLWTNKGREVPNADLWQELWKLNETHDIAWKWVKGHAATDYNNRCDRLAVEAIKKLKRQEAQ